MSLLNYFKRKDGLPDPRGTLSAVVPSKSIASANRAVEVELCRINKLQLEDLTGSWHNYFAG